MQNEGAEAAEVACGGSTHRLAIVGPELVLVDHDEDAENVLLALEGEVPECLRLAAMWRNPTWPDAVACLLLDDMGAAATASGKATAALGLAARLGHTRTRAGLVGVERLRQSAALLDLPTAFRRACGRRALMARVERWRDGSPMSGPERELIEHGLEPLIGRRLHVEGRHLPPGGRPVRVHVVGPTARPALIPGRRAWEARVPVDEVGRVLAAEEALSPWFEGLTDS